MYLRIGSVLALTLAIVPMVQADRALLIGINAYERDSRIPHLYGAVQDANAMQAMLLQHAGYQAADIKLLLDSEATRANILAAIENWLIAGTQPGERVLLHYSGHGTPLPDENGDETDGMDEALVAVDAYLDDKGTAHNMVLDDELGELLARLQDRRVTLVVDSCFSGTITRAISGPESPPIRTPLGLPTPQRVAITQTVREQHRRETGLLPSAPNQVVWTAVSPDQFAMEDREIEPRSGLFTNRFIRGVTGQEADGNGDGVVTHVELHQWLTQESDAYCQRLGRRCERGLTPTLELDRNLQIEPVATTLFGKPSSTAAVDTVTLVEETLVAPAPKPDFVPDAASTAALLQVKVEILPDSMARLGESVQFRVTSSLDGYLLLLSVDAAGQLVQLFPNKYSEKQGKRGRIVANRPITLPDKTYGFEFTTEEPVGKGRLYALVTTDLVDLSDIAPAARALEPVPVSEQRDYLAQIAERLRQTWPGDAMNRPVHWGIGEQAYEVTR